MVLMKGIVGNVILSVLQTIDLVFVASKCKNFFSDNNRELIGDQTRMQNDNVHGL
jgi:hypothetical protein